MSAELPDEASISATEPLVPTPALCQALQFGAGSAIAVGALDATSAAIELFKGDTDGWHLTDTLDAISAVVALGILRAFWYLGGELDYHSLRRLAFGVFIGNLLGMGFGAVTTLDVPAGDLPAWVNTTAIITLTIAAIATTIYSFGPTFRQFAVPLLFLSYFALKFLFRGARRGAIIRGVDADETWLLIGVCVGVLALVICHLCFGITVLRARSQLGRAATAFGWTEILLTVAMISGIVWFIGRLWQAIDQPNFDEENFAVTFTNELQAFAIGRIVAALLITVTIVWLFRSVHSRAAPVGVG